MLLHPADEPEVSGSGQAGPAGNRPTCRQTGNSHMRSKRSPRRRSSSAALCLLAALAGLPAPADAQERSTAVAVNNRSSQDINNIYLSPAGNDKWGEDRLGDRVLGASGRVTLDPGLANGCVYDVRVIYEDKSTEEKRNQNLCELNELTFSGPAEIDTAIDIVNGSPLMIHFLYISPTGSTDWGRDWLGADTAMKPGARGPVNPGRDAGCHYDLRVIYENKETEERRNQNLCEITEVVFSGGTPAAGTPPVPRPASRSFGTGFFVTADGYALTNHHVIEDCRSVALLTDRGALPARVVRQDERNDLALLLVEAPAKVAFATFRAAPGIRPGDSVVVPGFPLPTVLQNGLNVTVGNVSALAGVGGNSALLQMTAPVQPGNSGGPLLDMAGNLVGVIVSKLDALGVAKETGDIPQNINFAVQGSIARLFLEAQGLRVTEKSSAPALVVGDVVDSARAYTFQVECQSASPLRH
jgi:serine protease Do